MKLISEFSISNFRKKVRPHTRKVKGKTIKVNYGDKDPKISKVEIKDSTMIKKNKYYDDANLEKNQLKPKSVVAYEVIDTPIRKVERVSTTYKNIVSPTSRMIDSISNTSKIVSRSQRTSRDSSLDKALKVKRLFS